MIRALLLVALSAGGLRAQSDGLGRLSTDPSPAATGRLTQLYESTKNPDQRFWIIHALGARLKDYGDAAAMETLIRAAAKESGELRAQALRSLASFTALPADKLQEPLLARLETAAGAASAHKDAGVRSGAADLKRAVEIWRDPALRTTPPPPEMPTGAQDAVEGAARFLRWGWIVFFPMLAAAWRLFGFPVFDLDSPGGRRASLAWSFALRTPVLAGLGVFLWICLAALAAGYGFDVLAMAFGRPVYELSGGWLRAYASAVLCVVLPAGLFCAGLARRPENPAASSLTALPQVLAAWLAACLLLPADFLYSLFLRGRSARTAGPLRWVLEAGALRAGYLLIAVGARERLGLGPALDRVRSLERSAMPAPLGLSDFDPRFTVLCAAPVLAVFCAVIARGQPVVWTVSSPVLLIGCAVWAWCVLAAVLTAVGQFLEGALCAARLRKSLGDDMPAPMRRIADADAEDA